MELDSRIIHVNNSGNSLDENMIEFLNKMADIVDGKTLKQNNMEQTLGQKRVRVSFNPSADSVVDQIKQLTAHLIDLCEELKPLDPRLASVAQTEYESACHWAVKAATAGK